MLSIAKKSKPLCLQNYYKKERFFKHFYARQ
jgi:hypothetical protein